MRLPCLLLSLLPSRQPSRLASRGTGDLRRVRPQQGLGQGQDALLQRAELGGHVALGGVDDLRQRLLNLDVPGPGPQLVGERLELVGEPAARGLQPGVQAGWPIPVAHPGGSAVPSGSSVPLAPGNRSTLVALSNSLCTKSETIRMMPARSFDVPARAHYCSGLALDEVEC